MVSEDFYSRQETIMIFKRHYSKQIALLGLLAPCKFYRVFEY